MKQSDFAHFMQAFDDHLKKEKRQIIYSGQTFYEYSDGAWDVLNRAELEGLDKTLYDLATDREFPFSKNYGAVWTTMRAHFGMSKPILFDKEPMLVTQKRTFFPEIGKLRKHDAANYATRRVDVEADPDAECPQWRAMLDRIFSDYSTVQRQEIVSFLQEWFGVSIVRGPLVNNNRALRHGLILHGPRYTGKTTILEILRLLIGSRTVSPTLSSLKKDFGIEQLLGANALLSDDAADSETVADTKSMKTLVTGEQISVNRKYQAAVQFRFNGPVLFTLNDLPKIKAVDDSVYDRYVMINVTRQFDARDAKRDFKGCGSAVAYIKKIGELPGILNWAVDGYLRAIDRGRFLPLATSAAASRQFRSDNDVVFDFLSSCCESKETVQNPSNLIAAVCVEYAKSYHGISISQAKATKDIPLTARDVIPGVQYDRAMYGNKNQVRSFIGLGLNALGKTYLDSAHEAGNPVMRQHKGKCNFDRVQ